MQASLRELRHDAVKAALEPDDNAPPPQKVRETAMSTTLVPRFVCCMVRSQALLRLGHCPGLACNHSMSLALVHRTL